MVEMLAVMSVILILLSFAAVNSVGLKKHETESKAKLYGSILQTHLSNFATSSDKSSLSLWETRKMAGRTNAEMFEEFLQNKFSPTQSGKFLSWANDFEPAFEGYTVNLPQNPFGAVTIISSENNQAIYP